MFPRESHHNAAAGVSTQTKACAASMGVFITWAAKPECEKIPKPR